MENALASIVGRRKRDETGFVIVFLSTQLEKAELIEGLKKEYPSLVLIDFQTQPEVEACFDFAKPKDIITQLEIFFKTTIIKGETLLLAVNVQSSPKGFQGLRNLHRGMRAYYIIAAGF